MDTEKNLEMQEKIEQGKPVTDEGPYYHHAFWEGYKGSVKGQFGGLTIGALMGAVAGLVGASALAIIHPAGLIMGPLGWGGVVAAFSAAGLWVGRDEFKEVGAISGTVAAGFDTHEQRERAYQDGKFAQVDYEIKELKNMIAGKTGGKVEPLGAPPVPHEPAYRTSHFVPSEAYDKQSGLVFWKIAAIGLVVGVAAGAIIAAGLGAQGLDGLGSALGIDKMISQGALYAVSMTAFGAMGASFGINRDIFRKIFDKTDVMYKGIVPTLGQEAPSPSLSHVVEKQVRPAVTYENEVPSSPNYYRDRVLAQAIEALNKLDHTNSMRH